MNDDNEVLEYFATCPKQIEGLLEEELRNFGCEELRQTVAGVSFVANKKTVYRVLMATRLANRILWPLAKAKAQDSDEIYAMVVACPWEDILPTEARFVVDFIGSNAHITNTQFGAQRVKDGIVDRFVERSLPRPEVDKAHPQVRINVRLAKHNTIVAIDLAGESLHRRGYRSQQGAAPLKENLAAAILLRAGWPEHCVRLGPQEDPPALVDPMCGSGTILIEAAMIAARIAPGLARQTWSLMHLPGYSGDDWQQVKSELEAERLPWDGEAMPLFYGADIDPRMIGIARANIQAAGLEAFITLESRGISELEHPFSQHITRGLVICNPPYGERLGELESLRDVYLALAKSCKRVFAGWQLAVLTSNHDLAKEMRLRPKKVYKFYNGTLAAELPIYDLLGDSATLREDRNLQEVALSEGAQMVANRLKKNQKRLASWLAKEHIQCYRLYDADMPEYAAAIDIYGEYFHVQEYQAPKSVNESKAQQRFKELIHALVHTFNIAETQIFAKTRARQRGKSQYEKSQEANTETIVVKEGKASLLVNLHDYLDTGLFLDHRPLRLRIAREAFQRSFLNLYCYTASATVHAALGGASSSVSVDLSNTYLDWAQRNLACNHISHERHQLVRADCTKWLDNCRQGFDLILLDPPTFSNSKNTDTVLDIQRDHDSLVTRCMELLNPGGSLYFSNNCRSFRLHESISQRFHVEDITASTLDLDFKRNQKIHRCWKIQQP